MKKPNLILLFIFIFLATLNIEVYSEEEISELLQKYEEASELSQKTRIESLGHVVVYTRKDLEIMQAYTLSDVLRTLKLNQNLVNRFGVVNMTNPGVYPGTPTSFRLYINNQEVSSVHTDNPFFMFDYYPLDHIDHIEIYIGAGSIRLGDEPSLMIIKLYTKEPKRENVFQIRGTVTSKSGYETSFFDARGVTPRFSYLFLYHQGYLNFDAQKSHNQEILRDLFKQYLYLNLIYSRTSLQFNLGRINRYIFQGLSVDGAPSNGRIKSYDYDINLTHYFDKYKSFKLNISLNHNYRNFKEENELTDGGIFLPKIYEAPPSLSTPIFYHEERNLEKYNIYLGKEFNTRRNSFLTAISFKKKKNNIKEIKYKTVTGKGKKENPISFDKETIYSLILENQFNVTDRHLLFTSLKVDRYLRNGNYDDFTDFIVRVGFISSPFNNWFLKGFVTRTYVPPSFFETELSTQNLKQEVLTGATFEIINETNKHRFSFLAGYVNIEDLITFTENGNINLPNDVDSILTSVDYEYKFNYNSKILLNYYKTFYEDDFASSKEGGSIQLFKRTDKFDFYGGFIFKKGFKLKGVKIDNSYDLSFGISYNITKTLSLKFKGENLLNNSLRVIYFTPFEISTYDSLQRKYFFTFEKVF